jgi:prolyl oligopeptidase
MMMAMTRYMRAVSLGLIAASLAIPASCLAAVPAYPGTPVKEVVHQYGNVHLADSFAWLEEGGSSVDEWFRAQDAYAREYIGGMALREEIFQHVEEIEMAKSVEVYGFNRRMERYFYMRREVGEEVARLYYRDGVDGTGRLIFDAGEIADTDIVHSIQGYQPSHDGQLVGVSIGAAGAEIPDLYIVHVASGDVVDGPIPRVRSTPAWLEDGSGFYYRQLRPDEPGQDPVDRYKRQEVRFHRLRTPVADDPAIVSFDELPLPGMTDVDTASIVPIPDSPYTLAILSHGVDPADSYFFARDVDPARPGEIDWIQICDREDSVESIDYHEGVLYLLSSKNADRREILSVGLEGFDKANITTLLPEGEKILLGFSILSGKLYVTGMDGGIDFLMTKDLLDPATGFEPVKLPMIGRVTLLSNDYRMKDPYFSLTSWTRAPAYFRYDPDSGRFTQSDLRPLGPFDAPKGLVAKRLLVPSHDGVEVPLTVIHHESVELDGNNPAILYGYGAYGRSMRPAFGPMRLAWLDRGGVYAVAHVRGGGEFGKKWHDGGHIETKYNSWYDFHACAEYLIDNGYSAMGRIGGVGGSMGGVLVGRALTSRPDLYGAIVSSVGTHNPVRNHRRANGPANYPEYGSPLNPEELPYVLAMDSYFAVRDGVDYPPVLLTTGYNDTRVDPWMPGKMAARLQQANPEGGPYLLRVEFEAGHGGVGRSAILERVADFYTFLFEMLAE